MNPNSTKLFGKYRAQVLNITDPEMRGRILVKSPKVLNNHELGWAESCFMPGQFFLPRKQDYVWIEFEEGDVHKPIWMGIMPTRAYVRDFIMREAPYHIDKGYVVVHGGVVDILGDSVDVIANNRIGVTAGNKVDVKGTELVNNNYWSKDRDTY